MIYDIESLKGEVSIKQFIVNAFAEKIASLKTLDYLQERAREGSREHTLELLRSAPEREPDIRDKL